MMRVANEIERYFLDVDGKLTSRHERLCPYSVRPSMIAVSRFLRPDFNSKDEPTLSKELAAAMVRVRLRPTWKYHIN